MERMDKHLTLTEAEQYKLTNYDKLMEYLMLRPKYTDINVDLFVDDSESYKRNNHQLLLFARNSYGEENNSFIPFSVEQTPFVLDDEVDFKISYDDIFSIQDFIQSNLNGLIALANGEISQVDFAKTIQKQTFRLVAEGKLSLKEMATFREKDSGLPMDIWLDENKLFQGHAPRIKFRANNEQRTTDQFSSMTISDNPTI